MSSSSSLMKAWNCSTFLYAFTNITALVRSVDPHCTSWLAKRDGAEQTSQKFQDPAGLRMKVWRPSLPDFTNKIRICLRESWRGPYGSRLRLYAIMCLTSWDWNASDYVGSHTRWLSIKKLNVHNMLKRCCRFLLRTNRQDSISDPQVTSPGCSIPITNGQDELPRGMMSRLLSACPTITRRQCRLYSLME
jgi:hypothetical protein